MSEETGIYGKLLKAEQAMQQPVKDTSAYQYKYATLPQVITIVKTALWENGLGLKQRRTDGDGGSVLTTSVFDSDGTELELDSRRVVDSDNAQTVGSSETYMRRYALMTAFGLAAEDDDGAATVTEHGDVEKARERLANACIAYAGRSGQDVASVKSAAWKSVKSSGNDAAAYEQVTKVYEAL